MTQQQIDRPTKLWELSIETTGRSADPPTRVRRTSTDSDLIIYHRIGDDITHCRDRFPLNVWVEDHFGNVPWFICQPGFDIEIDTGRSR